MSFLKEKLIQIYDLLSNNQDEIKIKLVEIKPCLENTIIFFDFLIETLKRCQDDLLFFSPHGDFGSYFPLEELFMKDSRLQAIPYMNKTLNDFFKCKCAGTISDCGYCRGTGFVDKNGNPISENLADLARMVIKK